MASLNTDIHSIDFKVSNTTYNTFTTWGLVPASRPYVSPPGLKTKYVDLPASDGILDYTELLLGKVPWGRRSGSWKFYTDLDKRKELGFTWDSLYLDLISKLHGKEFQIILKDDPDYYYTGRVGVNSFKSSSAYSEIAIDYNLEPFKKSFTSSDDEDWQFDDAIEVPNYEILYGNYQVGAVKALTHIYHGEQSQTPSVDVHFLGGTIFEVCYGFGDIIGDVMHGDYGYTEADKRNRLAAQGLDFNYIQNVVNQILLINKQYPVDPTSWDSRMQIALAQGRLDKGSVTYMIEGMNITDVLELKPGKNYYVLRVNGQAQVHMKYAKGAGA